MTKRQQIRAECEEALSEAEKEAEDRLQLLLTRVNGSGLRMTATQRQRMQTVINEMPQED